VSERDVAIPEVAVSVVREQTGALTGRSYVGGTGSWTTFAERFTAVCAKLGVFDAERICFVPTAPPPSVWIRARRFPTALELLDWYHVHRRDSN
jgi:hypothetical protein